jgi:flagellar FliL protein
MKKLLIVLILPLILLIGAGAGAFFFGFIPGFGPGMLSESDKAAKAPKEDLPPEPFVKTSELAVYYTMDEFVVNLRSRRRRPVFLLLSLSLEVPDESAQVQLKPMDPRRRQHLSQQLDTRGPVRL